MRGETITEKIIAWVRWHQRLSKVTSTLAVTSGRLSRMSLTELRNELYIVGVEMEDELTRLEPVQRRDDQQTARSTRAKPQLAGRDPAPQKRKVVAGPKNGRADRKKQR